MVGHSPFLWRYLWPHVEYILFYQFWLCIVADPDEAPYSGRLGIFGVVTTLIHRCSLMRGWQCPPGPAFESLKKLQGIWAAEWFLPRVSMHFQGPLLPTSWYLQICTCRTVFQNWATSQRPTWTDGHNLGYQTWLRKATHGTSYNQFLGMKISSSYMEATRKSVR